MDPTTQILVDNLERKYEYYADFAIDEARLGFFVDSLHGFRITFGVSEYEVSWCQSRLTEEELVRGTIDGRKIVEDAVWVRKDGDLEAHGRLINQTPRSTSATPSPVSGSHSGFQERLASSEQAAPSNSPIAGPSTAYRLT
ncbi:hypothetical protein LTR12_011005 [Friedmanniomyces endolithicus]|nr:hypothetical protein LTR12_011005 [Friedmanniomyces endolithicus]